MKEDNIKSFVQGSVFLVILAGVFVAGMLSGIAIGAVSLVSHDRTQSCDGR